MFRELNIKNFSIIDDVTIGFEEGFNVLTGETGAGKSILINALSIALGERASGDLIRHGKKEAIVEAFFDITPDSISPSKQQHMKDQGIDASEGIILKRIITGQGRSRAYINGSMVNAQMLTEFSKDLVDIHGQYEHQSLLSSNNQLDLLDSYGKLTAERKEFTNIYESLLDLKHQLGALQNRERERAQRTDILKFQINEIESAQLVMGEDTELEEKIKLLESSGRLAELANGSYDSLYASDQSCLSNLSDIYNNMKEIAEIDGRASESLKALEDALPLLEETSYFLRDYRDNIDFSPDMLESSMQRLELIKTLKRKYGSNIQEILDFHQKASIELEELQFSEEKLGTLAKDLTILKQNLTSASNKLSEKRSAIAKKIEKKVESELSELSMGGTKFAVQITRNSGNDTSDGFAATESGIDNLEFLIAPNVGEDLKPIAKTASGGELSRIMLALKGILAKEDSTPTLIFDEIDSGIGGETAETVGRKLRALSSKHQVISITHLPQIASHASNHLKIQKQVSAGRTSVEVSKVDKSERTEEVARMLSGKISDASMKHARELLKRK